MKALKKMPVGSTQSEREANVQARLERFKTLPAHEREKLVQDEMNYSLTGGLGGLVHAAKTYAEDTNRPEEAREKYNEAAGWGAWALRSQKNPWLGEMRLRAAVKCGTLVSEATRTYAIGWIGNGNEKGNV
jgi:hypothetical protein